MNRYDPHEPTARVSTHQIEVPGAPEDVWRAIATGPGIATWWVPAEVEEREGGRIVTDHGPFGTSEGIVTGWEPPHRFAYEERDWNPEEPAAPPWATELLVEARSGDICVVRLVSGFFEGGGGWEDQLEGTDEGWRAALRNLRLALTHFRGLDAAVLVAMGVVADRGPDEVAEDLLAALGLDGAQAGDSVRLRAGAPPTSGRVAAVEPRAVVLLTHEPHAGILEVGTFAHAGATAAVRAYLFGDGGQSVAEAQQPRWMDWLRGNVPGLSDIRALGAAS